VEHGKEDKVIIYKYKSKDNSRRKQGHRQPYTKLEITAIGTGKAVADDEDAKEAKAAVEAETEVKEAPKAAPKAKAVKADVEAAAEVAPKAKAAAKPKAAATEAKATEAAPKAKKAAKTEE